MLINQRFERLVTNIYKLRRGRTSPVEGISRLLLCITARDDRNVSIFVATFTTDGRISRSGAVPKEISTDFLNRAESWIYEKILSNNVSPRTSREGVIRFNYQTCGRAGTLEETLMKFRMNVCAGWANTGIKLMTYAANTRPTRKYELFSAWPSERSSRKFEQIRERNKFLLAIVTIGLRLNLPNIELDKDGVNVYLERKKI